MTLPTSSQAHTLPGLPTEVLIRIFSHLQVADLLSVQNTCRIFCDVISDSASLQYVLYTEVNLLEDLLPLDISLHDRVALLKHHEIAWNSLQLNIFTRFLNSEESHAHFYHFYILQDGYLIYKAITNSTVRYGYIDLYSSSARRPLPNTEARWAHILLAVGPLSDVVFAVDHNLVVAIRRGLNEHEASFFEFKTGAHHPLSLVHTVSLPTGPIFGSKKPEVEVFGDFILVTATHEVMGRSGFSVVSWKTGRATQLYQVLGEMKVMAIDPENSLIALIKSATNSIEVCKLQFVSTLPCLHTLCFLRLPGFKFPNSISKITRHTEWIPTSRPQDRTESQASRGRLFPFRSYRPGTIALILIYKTQSNSVCQFVMYVSVETLLSVAHSGVRHVPWAEWGPAGTRILPFGNSIPPRPPGPFWITSYAPLVVRDYNSLRTRYIKKKKKLMSSIPTEPSRGPCSTKLFGEHWTEGEIETRLPFRKIVADGLSFKRVVQVVADREWFVVVARTRSGKRTSITVYHVG